MKAHYLLVAAAHEQLTPDEIMLAGHVDRFVRSIRTAELLQVGGEDRFSFIQKHVEAAYEYYSMFDMKDMAGLAMLDELAAALKEKVDEE